MGMRLRILWRLQTILLASTWSDRVRLVHTALGLTDVNAWQAGNASNSTRSWGPLVHSTAPEQRPDAAARTGRLRVAPQPRDRPGENNVYPQDVQQEQCRPGWSPGEWWPLAGPPRYLRLDTGRNRGSPVPLSTPPATEQQCAATINPVHDMAQSAHGGSMLCISDDQLIQTIDLVQVRPLASYRMASLSSASKRAPICDNQLCSQVY